MTTLFPILILCAWAFFASFHLPDSFYNLALHRLRMLLLPVPQALTSRKPFKRISEAQCAVFFVLFLWIAGTLYLQLMRGGHLSAAIGYFKISASTQNPLRALLFTLGTTLLLAGKLALLRCVFEWRSNSFSRPFSGKSSFQQVLDCVLWPLPKLHDKTASTAASFLLLFVGVWMLLGSADQVGGIFMAHRSLWPLPENGGSYMLPFSMFIRAAIDTLYVLYYLEFALVIGSFFTLFKPGNLISAICREWLQSIAQCTLGRSLVFGMLDVTPVVLLFVLPPAHKILTFLLFS